MIKTPIKLENGMMIDAKGRWIDALDMPEIIRVVNTRAEMAEAIQALITASIMGRPTDIAKARQRGIAAIAMSGGLS